ncbi:penicillin-binding protein 2 [Kriegella sp. EG-1]|nr:penicillin-binding protein 2 [Flavobacteriaceae bacterium EG-1]
MKKILLSSIIIIIGIVFLGRLSYLQIFSFSPDQLLEDPAIKAIYDYPERGYIYDRNGKLLVGNDPAYDVMVIPREVKAFDTLEFCSLLNLKHEKLIKELKKARNYSPRLPSVLVPQLSKEDYARLQEKMRHYTGFYIQKRSLRYYDTNSGANVLGYISEVNDRDLAKNPYYVQGELTGRTGVEKVYEDTLRGRKGIQYIQKDRFNRDIGKYKDGEKDIQPIQGKEITLTIDKDLQEYGEKLMHGKWGGIVAIEPSSGEILTMISGPTYDPSLLVGRKRSANYSKLHYDSISKPTFDRSISFEKSPGSPFKTINALIALQVGAVTPSTTFTCHHGFYIGRSKKGCHCGGGARNLNNGIYKSCNAYFVGAYKKIFEQFPSNADAMDAWEGHVRSFGLGSYLGSDLHTGRPGTVPSTELYNKWYGEGDKRWSATTTYSNAIGQGEVNVTPIQLANMTAAIANRGHFFTPHIIKKIEGKAIDIPKFTERKNTTIDRRHFEPVIQGMADVYHKGTAKYVQIPDIEIAGKTGTVENFMVIDSVRTQLTDNSVFVAFAPVNNPKIALAVYIQNGYYGSRYAGHIASLLIEKYLKGEITRKDLEKRMLERTLEREYAKPYSGKEFKINEYDWSKDAIKHEIEVR